LNISSPNANILNDVINGLLPSSYAMQNVAVHVTSLTPTTDINGNTIPSEANGITKIIDSPFLYGINAGKLAIIAFGVSPNAGFGAQNVSTLAAVSPSAAAVTTKLMVKIDYKYDSGSPHTGSMIALKNRQKIGIIDDSELSNEVCETSSNPSGITGQETYLATNVNDIRYGCRLLFIID
jgi:hypothetical protein